MGRRWLLHRNQQRGALPAEPRGSSISGASCSRCNECDAPVAAMCWNLDGGVRRGLNVSPGEVALSPLWSRLPVRASHGLVVR